MSTLSFQGVSAVLALYVQWAGGAGGSGGRDTARLRSKKRGEKDLSLCHIATRWVNGWVAGFQLCETRRLVVLQSGRAASRPRCGSCSTECLQVASPDKGIGRKQGLSFLRKLALLHGTCTVGPCTWIASEWSSWGLVTGSDVQMFTLLHETCTANPCA